MYLVGKKTQTVYLPELSISHAKLLSGIFGNVSWDR
jgi:hypothetical protein